MYCTALYCTYSYYRLQRSAYFILPDNTVYESTNNLESWDLLRLRNILLFFRLWTLTLDLGLRNDEFVDLDLDPNSYTVEIPYTGIIA